MDTPTNLSKDHNKIQEAVFFTMVISLYEMRLHGTIVVFIISPARLRVGAYHTGNRPLMTVCKSKY